MPWGEPGGGAALRAAPAIGTSAEWEVLAATGLGDTTRREVAASGLSAPEISAVIAKWRSRSGKGLGALVGDLRTAAADKAWKRTREQRRQTLLAWVRTLAPERKHALLDAYRDTGKGRGQSTIELTRTGEWEHWLWDRYLDSRTEAR